MRTHRPTPTILLLAGALAALLAVPAGAGEAVAVAKSAEPGGELLRLTLSPELGGSWREVHVGRVAIRTPGRQHRLAEERFQASAHLDLRLEEPGCTMVLVDLGPTSARGQADSWRRITHSTKIVTCASGASPREALRDRRRAGEVLMAKVGSRIEIRPFANPALIRPGSDLPVCVYFENVPRVGVEVTARGPEGELLAATTDAVGTANFKIPTSGRWVIRYATRHPTFDPPSIPPYDKGGRPRPSQGVGYAAELEFEVPAAELWQSLPLPTLAAGAQVAPVATDLPVWEELGPAPITSTQDTGRAAAIATSATRRNRYYVGGASGGVWESVDGGASWTVLGDHLPTLAIGAVALDPVDDKVIYVGSGEANAAYHSLYGLGLYKSTDRGRSWQILARQTFAGRAFARLVVSPFDRRVVWAAVGRAGGTYEGIEGARRHPQRDEAVGIFRSRDGGVTWEHLRVHHGLPALAASDVDLDPRDRRRVYVSFGDPFGRNRNGIYRSTDGGASFEKIATEMPGARIGRVTLAIAPSDPQRLYALVTRPDSREWIGGFSPPGATTFGIYRSDDGGDGWIFFHPGNFQGQQGTYNSAVVVHPTDPDTFFVGGVQMLRSTDGGLSYQDVTPLHVDVHDLAFDAAGRLMVADDGGLHRSSDLGQTWIARNAGVGTVQFYAGLSLFPHNPVMVVGGTQDNGTNLHLGPVWAEWEWVRIFGGDGGYTAVKPDDPDVIFVEYQGANNLYRSTDGGYSFERSSTGIDAGDRHCFLPPVVFDPADPNRLLFATHRIYESTDVGRSWRPLSGDLTSGPPAAVRALMIAPSDSNVVYAMTNDGPEHEGRVLVSTNAGADWTLIREGVAGWPRVTRQLAVDPLRPAQLYVAVARFGGERLLVTYDRGATWKAIGQGLPNAPVNTVGVHRTAAGRPLILVGTDIGVYLSRNRGASWEKYGTGLPRAVVMDLVVDAARHRVVASTLGRGMWTAALPAER